MPIRTQVKTLQHIRGLFTPDAAAAKLNLLLSLEQSVIRQTGLLKSLHQSLCFILAFPDSLAHHKAAGRAIIHCAERVESLGAGGRRALADTGIEGTDVYYRYSYEVARWLARHCPDAVEVDWPEFDNDQRLDDILRHIVLAAETEFYGSGRVSERDWIKRAKGSHPATDFAWLMQQLESRPSAKPFWAELYDAADLPLGCRLGPAFAKGRNQLHLGPIKARTHGMRKPRGRAAHTVSKPLQKVRRLSRQQATRAIFTAMSALAVRQRETYHFNHANPAEVYAADIEDGVQILVYGLLPEYRFSLETTMGYLITANGMPVGYGGASAIFRQANTGINIFDEYRGSEAAYLWLQVLRTYHHLFGCSHFIVSPYQIGAGNKEALRSGAFWFYYWLGFRPARRDVAPLAANESARIETQPGYRSNLKTLKQLTVCDMRLSLGGAARSDFFEERWVETCAAGATDALAAEAVIERRAAAHRCADHLLHALGRKSCDHWSRNERQALLRLSPILNLLPDLAQWKSSERTQLVQLIRAKGGECERDYLQIMRRHDRLRRSLVKYCRRCDRR